MTRCKFRCDSKTHTQYGHTIKLVPVTQGSPENEKFFQYTPFGSMEFGTINGEAAAQFEPGKEYYIDIKLAE